MSIRLDELIAVHEARMRLKKEQSKALPAHRYRDPAETVEFAAEIERRRKAKEQKRNRERR